GQYQARAAASGTVLRQRLDALVERGLLTGARTVGLWAGVDVDPALGTGRDLAEALLERGVLTTDTHGTTVLLSPPLSIVQPELEMALDILEESLTALREAGVVAPEPGAAGEAEGSAEAAAETEAGEAAGEADGSAEAEAETEATADEATDATD